MANDKTDSELVEMVKSGGGRAFTAMGCVINNKRDYPGDVDDVFRLLSDTEPISFACSPSHLAQAYLFHKGLIRRSDVDECWQTDNLLKCYEAESPERHG